MLTERKGKAFGKGKVFGKGKTTSVRFSKSQKAGLNFPVARVSRYMKKGKFADHVASKASVFLSAVLEYLTAEVLELAGDSAKELHKARIGPSHIQLAVRNDSELDCLLANIHVSDGGVPPFIHSALFSESTKTQ